MLDFIRMGLRSCGERTAGEIFKTKVFLNTVKHFLFARTLFSRKFARPVTREIIAHANISHEVL